MKLEALTLDQCQQVRLWRNDALETLRTPYPLTQEQQEAFYRDVVCNRNSHHRYWAVVSVNTFGDNDEQLFYGMVGITNIQWENRIGEISLIIDPDRRGKGEGEVAVDLLLNKAFNYLNLQTVFGECYRCNPAWKFWREIANKYADKEAYRSLTAKEETIVSHYMLLPNRKYFNGKYWMSVYFSIDKEDFNAKKSNS